MLTRLSALLHTRTSCIWVLIAGTKGSVPREMGASMIVTKDQSFDTIGGGHLELKAIEFAREQIASCAPGATTRHFPLGPTLGQCCGGHVTLLFVPITERVLVNLAELQALAARNESVVFSTTLDNGELISVPLPRIDWHIAVFGAGHVGKAIVEVCSQLPCEMTWIDEREAEFPKRVADNVTIVHSDSPESEAARLPANTQVLVLTHSHALDLEICLALLKREDFSYYGLIGSKTKAATFRKRFAARGHSDASISRIISPIGRAELASKHPGAIAVSVAFDLAEKWQQHKSSTPVFTGAKID